VTIVNHPNGGPVFSGPQVQPWVCANPAATDDQYEHEITQKIPYLLPGGAGSEAAAYETLDTLTNNPATA